MLIHWIKDKKQQQPTTVAEVISKLQVGDMNEDTLAWHKGCAKWMPLKELPAMQDFFKPEAIVPENSEEEKKPFKEEPEAAPQVEHEESPAPASTPSAEALNKEIQEKLKSGDIIPLKMPSPLQRFLARMLDLTLYGYIYMLIVSWREMPYAQGVELYNPMLWLFFIPLEAAIISHFRTTPGKAFFGIRIYSLNGQDGLNFRTCMRRSFLVFALGLGMMLVWPPFCIFWLALFLSYRKLTKQGYTSWDERCQTVLLQRKKPDILRPYVAAFLLFYFTMSSVSMMQPWFPAMKETMTQQSPEAAEQFEKFKAMLPQEMQDEWSKMEAEYSKNSPTK